MKCPPGCMFQGEDHQHGVPAPTDPKAKLEFVVSTTCGNCGLEIRMYPDWMTGVTANTWTHADTGQVECDQ